MLINIQTGTAHAILKNLPLLDSLQDDFQKLRFVTPWLTIFFLF